MRILGIETSCDETAVCIIEAGGGIESPQFAVLGNALYSQVAVHKEYGGVFPALAKREHAKNLTHLLGKAIFDSYIIAPTAHPQPLNEEIKTQLKAMLEREEGLYDELVKLLESMPRPAIDMIAVTQGPGLEPALWVGVNFAKALALAWHIPLFPINHMEGHILSPLIQSNLLKKLQFPALSLLLSGGHTELVLVKDWLEYEVIGQTKDDAVGEAFDKVARMLGLPYPGGPEISKLAETAVADPNVKFPRPMMNSGDLNFSFSGLKTAVLYFIKKQPTLTPELKAAIAREFEDAVIEVLISKTKQALAERDIKMLILGGGVIANKKIRLAFEELVLNTPNIHLLLPPLQYSTDNAVMIAVAGYFNFLLGRLAHNNFGARGNLSL